MKLFQKNTKNTILSYAIIKLNPHSDTLVFGSSCLPIKELIECLFSFNSFAIFIYIVENKKTKSGKNVPAGGVSIFAGKTYFKNLF